MLRLVAQGKEMLLLVSSTSAGGGRAPMSFRILMSNWDFLTELLFSQWLVRPRQTSVVWSSLVVSQEFHI